MLLVLLVPELLTGPRVAPLPTPAQPDQAPMRSYTMDLAESARINTPPWRRRPPRPPAAEPAVTGEQRASAASPAAARRDERTAAHAAHRAPRQCARCAQVRATTPPRPPAPAPAHAVEHAATTWTVQLGTFSSRENAVHLVNTLKSPWFWRDHLGRHE